MIYFQGHPEYDINSLLKEFKRELLRYRAGELQSLPPIPQHYFSKKAIQQVEQYFEAVKKSSGQTAQNSGELEDNLAEKLEGMLDNTWGDTAKAVVNNWLGLVYQVTNLERTKQFMDDVDRDDPLALTRN